MGVLERERDGNGGWRRDGLCQGTGRDGEGGVKVVGPEHRLQELYKSSLTSLHQLHQERLAIPSRAYLRTLKRASACDD